MLTDNQPDLLCGSVSLVASSELRIMDLRM